MTTITQFGKLGERSLQKESQLGKISYRTHLSIYAQLLGCDPRRLADEKFVTSTVLASVVLAGMKLLDYTYRKFEGGGGGITAVAIVSDSHIIVNTFPELGLLVLDIYACTGTPMLVLQEFLRRFQPEKYEFTVLPRVLGKGCIEPRVILDRDSVGAELAEWLKKRGMLPLINTSEAFLTLTEMAGFLLANHGLNGEQLVIESGDRLVLEVLKERLRNMGVDSEILVTTRGFALRAKDETLILLLRKLGFDDSTLPAWLREADFPVKAVFMSSFLHSKIKEPELASGYVELEIEEKIAQYISEILGGLYIEHTVRSSGERKIVRIELNSENLLRLKSILSLVKIFPLSIFPENVDFSVNGESNVNLDILYELIGKALEKNVIDESVINQLGEEARVLIFKLLEAGILKKDGASLRLVCDFRRAT